MRYISGTLCVLSIFYAAATQGQPTNAPIPFYALPYYNYKPLTITIGKYKKELLTTDTTALTRLAATIKADINNTDVESLYFLSIRLYDMGKKDAAFYWFQTAKARARVFMTLLDPAKTGGMGAPAFERVQLFGAINETVGEYLNGYGFNDIDKGLAVFIKVKSEVKDIRSYKAVYKQIVFLDDAKLESAKAAKVTDLEKTIAYIKANKADIKAERIKDGVQDKY
jgi:hypothetical protein